MAAPDMDWYCMVDFHMADRIRLILKWRISVMPDRPAADLDMADSDKDTSRCFLFFSFDQMDGRLFYGQSNR